MDLHPTFSIITVTWSDLAGLTATGASIERQSEQDYEWIVIDGGSTDGTPEWLSRQSQERCRWVSERDGGIYDAMNKGLDRAGGTYFVLLNAGDVFAASDVLAKVRACAQAGRDLPDLIYGDSVDVRPDGTRLYRSARKPSWLRFGMFTSHQAMFFRRGHAAALRHDLSFPHSGDYAFVSQFLHGSGEAARCEYIPEPLCEFALGGAHFQHRFVAMREDYRIRREILRESLPLSMTLWLLHALHQQVKLRMPHLATRLRYR